MKAIRQYADYHNEACNQEIANFANQRLSQATDNELSQLSQDLGRTKTVKGMFKINANDISKVLASGLQMSSKNSEGNKRGVGRIKRTIKKPDKRPRNWVKEHRRSFIENRNRQDMAFQMYFC